MRRVRTKNWIGVLLMVVGIGLVPFYHLGLGGPAPLSILILTFVLSGSGLVLSSGRR